MSILVTGAGLLGSQVAKILTDNHEKAIVYDVAPQVDAIRDIISLDSFRLVRGDLLDLPTIIRTIRDESVTGIIHTAGLLVAATARNPYWGIQVNILGTANLFEAARLTDVKRFVFASSGIIYGPSIDGSRIREDHSLQTKSAYGICKLTGEYIGRFYAESYGLEFAAARFGLIFGPWTGTHGGAAETVIRDLVEKAVRGENAILDPTFMGRQLPSRLVYSRDAARAMVLTCFAKQLKHNAFNISMQSVPTWMELIDLVREMAPESNIGFDEEKFEKIPKTSELEPLDVTLAREELGFEALLMPEALMDYVNWLRQKMR